MEQSIIKLITAMGKINTQHKNKQPLRGFNSSETGIFWAVLQLVQENPSEDNTYSLSAVNSYLNFTRPNLSQTINKLEDNGYVERVVKRDNRRVTYIRLTEKGINMIESRYGGIRSRFERICEILGEEDTKQLSTLLTKFAEISEDLPD